MKEAFLWKRQTELNRDGWNSKWCEMKLKLLVVYMQWIASYIYFPLFKLSDPRITWESQETRPRKKNKYPRVQQMRPRAHFRLLNTFFDF